MTNQEFTVWLCPTPFQFPGICYPVVGRQQIETSKESYGEILVDLPLVPEGSDGDSLDVEVFIRPEAKSAIDCLFCFDVCDSRYNEELLISEFRSAILERMNIIRSAPLSPASDLMGLAQWFAEDMAANDYYASDHRDRWGRGVYERFLLLNSEFHSGAENLAEAILIDDDKSASELADIVLEGWMNSPGHRENLLAHNYREVGIGIAHVGSVTGNSLKNRYVVVSDFIQRDTYHNIDVPSPSAPCISECSQKLRWFQEYDLVSGWENLEHYKRRIPKPEIRIEVPIPALCGLKKLRLSFEISPCHAEWSPDYVRGKAEEDFGESTSIKLIWSDVIGDKWVTRWNLSHSACFVPGEWMMATAELDVEKDTCNPMVVAFGWFETPCWTSGILEGCGLVEDGNVVAGGWGSSLQEDWIGDDRLRWLVRFKGSYYWLRSTDFAEYQLNRRIFIFKGGYGMAVGAGYNIETSHGCRWPTGGVEGKLQWADEVMSYASVSYRLNPLTDMVVPQTFWGWGG